MYCAGCIGSDNKILSYYYDFNNYDHTCQSFQKVPSCSNFIEGFFRSICFERKTCGVSIIEACSIQKYRELQPFLIHHPILSFALIKEPLLQISNDSILYITFFMPNVVNNYLCENNVSGKTIYLH